MTPHSKYCVLLGDSYLEALQYQGNRIAAGIVQDKLTSIMSSTQIVNLGSSAHDPYVMWFRLKFYEKYYPPSRIFLVYESFGNLKHFFTRWKSPLDFSIQPKFGVEQHANKFRLALSNIRSFSAFLTILPRLFTKKTNDIASDHAVNNALDTISDESAISMLQDCLLQFRNKYGDSFTYISIMSDNPYEARIADFCMVNSINYLYNPHIMKPGNLINGDGHLNLMGNKLLAEYLFDFIENAEENKRL
ncbi:MAG: hypothetical protein PHO32_02575 [Candidatus Cloacimonetes bacterium]|nr:hypothetical protein [Candidatus Cloacimonadota bacterium]